MSNIIIYHICFINLYYKISYSNDRILASQGKMEDILLNINNKELSVHYDPQDKNKVYINGNPYKIELIKSFGNKVFSFSVNNHIKQIEIESNSHGLNRLAMDGMSFDINITDDTKKLLNKFIRQSSSTHGSSASTIKAPMPGMVVKILVQISDTVKKGDSLLIVEAMKMENSLKANASGTIKAIHVKEGQAVEKEQLLIELDN
ncbi:MAG: hypothetical protein QG635_2444 [Bacteroidota bacterium]|nr:hypothetical protein [Bacteroidota bacterium]